MECKIRDITLYYEINGTGKPVIMIHGYRVDHRLMTGCMEPVFFRRENYKRIYLDLPGMGGSECADWITNADVMLDVIIEFIEKIIPEENFILASESYGGYLSRGILYRMPHRVDGLLMIGPAIIADRTKRNLPEHVVLVRDDELLSSLSQEDAEEFNSDMVIQNRKTYERFKDEIVSGLRLGNSSFLDNFCANGYSYSVDIDAAVIYDKPVAILVGRQDACVGYKDAWNLLDHYPRATFAVLDMAGHNLQIEQEALFNNLVGEWLERVETTTKKHCLESERLTLRKFRSDDWKDLYEYLSSEEAVRYEPYDVFDEAASRQEAINRSNNDAFWAVCLKGSGKVIGNVYFQQQEPLQICTWEMGYVFNPSYWGFGYATESCRRILDYAFHELNAHRVIAMCNPDNTSSWKLLERLKMRREGHFRKKMFFKTDAQGSPLWHDAYEYAIIADEWHAHANKNKVD